MAEALGARFKDAEGRDLPPIGQNLSKVKSIDISKLDGRIKDSTFIIASDVDNPLYGKNGAAYVYGPQKGADENVVEELDMGLRNYAEIIEKDLGIDIAGIKSGGAAGGLGAGLVVFLDGQIKSGIDIVIENTKLEEKVKGVDLVITGEGSIDLGLIGFGNIGRATAKMGRAFGLRVISHTRSKTSKDSTEDIEFVTLEELLQRSDIVSLHSPLNPQSKEIINEESIGKMKDGVVIINTSRGQLIDEEALAKALKNGKVKAAGLDVVSIEPILPTNPLLQCDNAIITPHIAWAAKEARERLLNTVVENIVNYKNNRATNVVNK